MDNKTKWGGVWPFGTITLPIEPAPGMLVGHCGEWGLLYETEGYELPLTADPVPVECLGLGIEDHICFNIVDECHPLLPSRAQLEAAGLSVEDGLKLLFDDRQGALELKLPGEYRIVTASGDSFALAQPSWIEDEDELKLADDARQIYAALLAWAGVEDER